MKRCAIFIIYDPEGKVRKYRYKLLNDLKTCVDKLIIVFNGIICKEDKGILGHYTSYIYERENKGLDAGAYKELFTKILKDEPWDMYDEMILMNDTFYGFFSPLNDILEYMEGKDIDFWGMTIHPDKKQYVIAGVPIQRHIQSYFLVLNKQIIMDNAFMEFWKDMPIANNYEEAIAFFELQFTQYLAELGYRYSSFLDELLCDKEKNVIEEIKQIQLVGKLKFPICKRKECVLTNYIFLEDMLKYLKEETEYDCECIIEDMKMREELDMRLAFTPEAILHFCEKWKRIYLYGHGMIARNIAAWLEAQGIHVEGYIVTQREENDSRIVSIDEVKELPSAGIILALSERNTKEVMPIVLQKIDESRVWIPRYEFNFTRDAK